MNRCEFGLAVALLLGGAACGASDDGSGADAARDAGADAARVDGSHSAGAEGADAGDPDASSPESDAAPDAEPSHDASGDSATTSTRIVAGYYPNWTPSPVRIRDIDPHYNLIYLFSATPVGGAPGTTGAVEWSAPGDGRGAATNLVADIAYARKTQGRKVVLTIGGAKLGMTFPNRAKSQTFVDSVSALYTQFGGIDGIDWNTFEGNQAPSTSEMIWISQTLKAKYPGFLITATPAPWNDVDKTFCKAMVDAGVLDYAAPQYYDGPNLATQSYIESSVTEWSTLLGEDKVVVGFGVWDQPNYMTVDQAVSTWKSVAASHPHLRGAFDWEIHIDEAAGWPFADRVGPLVAP